MTKSVTVVSAPPACSDHECVRLCDLLIVCAVVHELQTLSEWQLRGAAVAAAATVGCVEVLVVSELVSE